MGTPWPKIRFCFSLSRVNYIGRALGPFSFQERALARPYKDLSSRSGRKDGIQRFIKFKRYYVNFIKFKLTMELYKVHPLTQALGAATSGSARTAVVSTSAVWRAHCQRIFCMYAVSTASCHESFSAGA